MRNRNQRSNVTSVSESEKKELKIKKIELLENEYNIAKKEWEYYTDLFNKQDNLYSVYFAIFAVVIGAIYYIIKESNDSAVFEALSLNLTQKIIIGLFIIFLAITYMYLFIILMGNSYYLIIYSSKIMVLEKKINQLMKEDILFWETEFMSIIQSTQNLWTKGYFNVNFLKMIYAILLYIVIEVPLGFLWWIIFGYSPWFVIYSVVLGIVSMFLLYDWLIMWIRLPKHYIAELETIYNKIRD